MNYYDSGCISFNTCEELGHSFFVTEWEQDESSKVANILLCQRCMGIYKYKEMKARLKLLKESL